MTSPRFMALVLILTLALPYTAVSVTPNTDADATRITALSTLDKQARSRVGAKPRVALAAETSDLFKNLESLETPESDPTPNYLRAVAVRPDAVKPMAHLVRTFVYGGQLEPELKMSMGLRIAQVLDSPYVAAHMQRLLRASERGQALLAPLKSAKLDALKPADRLALNYAEWLTQDVHGVSDENFRVIREYFNDSQIVELTTTVCLFNYLTRFSEALNLPVEEWALDSTAKPAEHKYVAPLARVALISDAEMQATADMNAKFKDPKGPAAGWGIGFANSMRSMLRAPDLAQAWMAYGTSMRGGMKLSRELQLQISFAVSTANGCRYCTLHQVLGLHRLGVDPAKLLRMQKDDSALTPQELSAVAFARKLTRAPSSITDADYAALQKEFGDDGALDVVLQTCNFAYMNRFTDGLHLPSEDEAVRVYHEIYGGDWKRSERDFR